MLSTAVVVCAPSQLETALPGHRKGHPSRLGHAVGPSTAKLLFFLKLEEIAAETAGRRHGRGTSVSGLQPPAVTSRESQVQPSQAVSRAACWGPPCTATPCLSMPGPVHRNVSSRLWMKSGAQCCISIA
jgi:hypothetical protein